jgi:hypothetical protein
MASDNDLLASPVRAIKLVGCILIELHSHWVIGVSSDLHHCTHHQLCLHFPSQFTPLNAGVAGSLSDPGVIVAHILTWHNHGMHLWCEAQHGNTLCFVVHTMDLHHKTCFNNCWALLKDNHHVLKFIRVHSSITRVYLSILASGSWRLHSTSLCVSLVNSCRPQVKSYSTWR